MGPIGVFDSGYGGLTVLNDFIKRLPNYDFIYLGDNARTPYGTRSFEVVYEYTLQAVNRLFDMGCPMVILACNTASAKALRSIQQNDLSRIDSNLRVLGVIRPSVEALGSISKNCHIGVVGTSGTVLSQSYPLEIAKLYPEFVVSQEACPMWVPLVENNEYNSSGADYFIQKNLNNLFKTDPLIDTLILGCTHYPILENKIRQYLSPEVQIMSQGSIVAESLFDYLNRHPEMDNRCSKNGKVEFFTTENPEKFSQTASIFVGYEIKVNHLTL